MYACMGSFAAAQLASRLTRRLLRTSLARFDSQSAHAAAARWYTSGDWGKPSEHVRSCMHIVEAVFTGTPANRWREGVPCIRRTLAKSVVQQYRDSNKKYLEWTCNAVGAQKFACLVW